jgi:hypothetical protein
MGPKGKKRPMEMSSEANDVSSASDVKITKKAMTTGQSTAKYVSVEHCKSW